MTRPSWKTSYKYYYLENITVLRKYTIVNETKFELENNQNE